MRITISGGLASAALAVIAAAPVSAAIVTVETSADIFSQPYTIDFGLGGTVTFSTVDPSPYADAPDGVSTTGSAVVDSFGPPFYATTTPTSYFSTHGGSFGPGTVDGFFASYPTATAIPYSESEGLIGLGYTLADGFHYAYADLAGSTLIGYRYATEPDEAIPFAPVPEPATWAMMVLGFGALGAAARRSRYSPAATRYSEG